MTTPPPLICFDLGRVLVRICESWAEAFAHAGLSGPPPDPKDPAARRAISARVHAFETGTISADEFADAVGALLEQPSAVIHRILDSWLRGPTPGATALLDDLRARGHRIACLSNTNARHWALMSRWDGTENLLWPRIDLRLASHELGLRKPDDAIYAALEKTARVAPADIVFFDDLAENVAAARARGWRAVEVPVCPDPVAAMRSWLAENGFL
jgi:putative hydrolase of the HAD superfamily